VGDVELGVRALPEHGEASPETPTFAPGQSYRDTRAAWEADFEKRYVSWLLARHGGNISAAAREADMDRKYLHRLALKHGVHPGPRARG
jgi:DNA-binding NtrC family response regulator